MKKFTGPIEWTIAAFGIGFSLYMAFFQTGVVVADGLMQKIFYFHVPSAYIMYLSWISCTVFSIIYVVKRTPRWDRLAKSSGEIALLFALMVMTSGPIWGRKSWGAYWVWEPRLTTALILTMVILSYVLLRLMAKGEAVKTFSAALAIMGATVIPFIHFAIQLWGQYHHPEVITGDGGGMAADVARAFITSMVSFTVFFIVLLRWRYKLELKSDALQAAKEQALVDAPAAEVPQ